MNFNKLSVSIPCCAIVVAMATLFSSHAISSSLDESEFDRQMRGLEKNEILLRQKNRIKELEDSLKGENQDVDRERIREDLRREVREDYEEQMDDFQEQIGRLRSINQSLEQQIKWLQSPDNMDVVEDHIFVTKTYTFGQNKKAQIFYNNHFSKMGEGEFIVNDVFIEQINDRGIVINKGGDESHSIYTTTREKAINNALRRGGRGGNGGGDDSGGGDDGLESVDIMNM